MATRYGYSTKNFEDIFIRFDRVHKRDRQTDKHRMTAQDTLMHCKTSCVTCIMNCELLSLTLMTHAALHRESCSKRRCYTLVLTSPNIHPPPTPDHRSTGPYPVYWTPKYLLCLRNVLYSPLFIWQTPVVLRKHMLIEGSGRAPV